MNQNLSQEIYDVVIGDDWVFERSYRGAPPGTNIVKAILTIKTDESKTDGEAAAQVEVTQAPSAAGQITLSGATGVVALIIKVPRMKTSAMLALPHVYDIQLEYNITGDKSTTEKGVIYPVSEVTRA